MDYQSSFVNGAIGGGSRLDYLELALAALDQAGLSVRELSTVIDALPPDAKSDVMDLKWVVAALVRHP